MEVDVGEAGPGVLGEVLDIGPVGGELLVQVADGGVGHVFWNAVDEALEGD